MTATVTSSRFPGALAAPVACGCCLVAGAAYVAASDPVDGGAFLPCPFRALTGWWCPGCGLTRATHHLLRGHVAQALRFNLLVLVILTAIGLAWAAWFADAIGRRPAWRVPAWASAAGVALLVAFAVVRNLPVIDGLRG